MHPRAPEGGSLRSRSVGVELQRRRAREVLLPELEKRIETRSMQLLSLPLRIIPVLDRQFGERNRFPAPECLIDHGEITQQHSERPAVRDDVMHRQHQHVPLLAQSEQPGAEQRPHAQCRTDTAASVAAAAATSASVPSCSNGSSNGSATARSRPAEHPARYGMSYGAPHAGPPLRRDCVAALRDPPGQGCPLGPPRCTHSTTATAGCRNHNCSSACDKGSSPFAGHPGNRDLGPIGRPVPPHRQQPFGQCGRGRVGEEQRRGNICAQCSPVVDGADPSRSANPCPAT